MKTLSEWLDYIGAIHVSSIDLGLQRVQQLAPQLLQPFSCPVITVGGTNGKGSVMRLLQTIYRNAGYRVAAYTSPHLHVFNERLQINGVNADDAQWIAAFEKIEAARQQISLSFFEFTTLAALYISQQQPLDVMLLEVGLGGRLDAVNIIDADVAVVTSIDIDHQDWLGSDRDSIGYEKAGIFRAKRPAICGDSAPPSSLAIAAQKINAQWLCSGEQFFYHENAEQWDWHGPATEYKNLPLPQLKIQNVATSLMAVECLQSRLPVARAVLVDSIATAQLAGRFEIRTEPVTCVFDVAHNPAAAAWLGAQLRQRFPQRRFIAVVGMLADKDIAATIASLDVEVVSWYFADLAVPRGATAAEIVARLRNQKNWYTFASVAQAITAAVQTAQANSELIVLVFGSFHTVAEAQSQSVFA